MPETSGGIHLWLFHFHFFVFFLLVSFFFSIRCFYVCNPAVLLKALYLIQHEQFSSCIWLYKSNLPTKFQAVYSLQKTLVNEADLNLSV